MFKRCIYFSIIFAAIVSLETRIVQAQTTRDSLRVFEANEVTITEDKETYLPRVSSVGAKTNTSLRDIPATISVVPLPVMKEQGATVLDQVVRNVAGVTQSSSNNYGFFNKHNVRGLQPKYLYNGLPDGPAVNGYARSLTGIQRVEVLKGPGSALYGGGETGGTINLVSKPLYSQPGLNFSQTFGSFGSFTSMLDAGTGLADGDVKTLLSVNYTTKEGWRNMENEVLEVIPSASFALSSSSKLTATIDIRNAKMKPDNYGIPLMGTSAGSTVYEVASDVLYYTPFSNTEIDIKRGYLSYSYIPNESFSLRASGMVSGRELFWSRNAGSTTVRRGPTRDLDTLTGRVLREQWDNVSEGLLQVEPVFSFNTGEMKHTLLAGFEYGHSNIFTFRQSATLPVLVNPLNPVIPETNHADLTFTKITANDRHALLASTGIYLQEQLAVTDQIKVRLGGRYDIFGVNDQHLSDNASKDTSYKTLSYQAGLVYQPIQEVSLFAGYGVGHQPTFTTEGTAADAPESAAQLEVGVKTALFDNTLNVNLTWFQVDRKDFFITINSERQPIGEHRVSGIDAEVITRLFDDLTLTGNVALYSPEAVTLGTADSARVGKELTGVPKTTAGLWAAYTIPTGALAGLGVGAGMSHRGDMYFNLDNTITIPGYTIFDAALFYRHKYFDAQVNIYNMTDEYYFRNGQNSGFLPGEPMNFTATVRVKL